MTFDEILDQAIAMLQSIGALPDMQGLYEPKAVPGCQGFDNQLVNGHSGSLPESGRPTAAAPCGCRQRLSPSL
jgi:hypothetical protein